MNAPGFSRTKFIVNKFFMMESPQGLNFIVDDEINPQLSQYFNDEKTDLKVDHIKISFDYLINILGKTTFSFEYDSQNRKKHFIANSEGYESDTYYIPSEELYVKDTMTTKTKSKSNHSYNFLELSFLKLFKDDKISDFSNLEKNANYIKDLFQFVTGTPLHFESIEFQTQETTVSKNMPVSFDPDTNTITEWEEVTETLPEIRGRYFYRQIGEPKVLKNSHFHNYSDIVKDFEDLLVNWYNKKEKLSFITESYLNDLTLPYFWDTKLLNAIRNLEVFYRNFKEEQTSLSEDYLREREKITSFIDGDISEEYKEKFISQVEYVGETSLRKKLNTLFKFLPEKLFNETIKKEGQSPSKSRNKFVNRLVETRNFRTHGDSPEKYPNKISDSFEVLYTTKNLALIQQYLIFKELGLEDESIINFQFG